jgi:hypothetical protein
MVHQITLFCFVVMGACMIVWLLILAAGEVMNAIGIRSWSDWNGPMLVWAGASVLVPSAVALIVMVGAMFIASAAETIAWIATLS